MTRFTFALTVLVSMAAQTASATDFSNVQSGLLLGVYASPGQGGMRVSSTIPGYSAQGRLYNGDVLLRAATYSGQVYRLRSHYEMEHAKIAIGTNQEAGLEIWRPGVGLIYAMVQFTPIYAPTSQSPVAVYSKTSKPQPRGKAVFRMESEKPGARQLFQKAGASPVQNKIPQTRHVPRPRNSASNQSAANLFNR